MESFFDKSDMDLASIDCSCRPVMSVCNIQQHNFQDFPGPNPFSKTFQGLEILPKEIQNFTEGMGALSPPITLSINRQPADTSVSEKQPLSWSVYVCQLEHSRACKQLTRLTKVSITVYLLVISILTGMIHAQH